jgi:hypothetical protein
MQMTEQPSHKEKLEESGYDEEFSGEVNPATPVIGMPLIQPEDDRPDAGSREFRSRLAKDEERVEARSSLGWASLVVAFVSLFLWPAILGPVAAVMGFVAYFQGSKALGIWSVVIGVISVLSYWVLVPYYA